MGNSCVTPKVVYVADVRAEEITQRRQMIWESMKHTVEKTITKAAFHSVDDLVWWVKNKPKWYSATTLNSIRPDTFNFAADTMDLVLSPKSSIFQAIKKNDHDNTSPKTIIFNQFFARLALGHDNYQWDHSLKQKSTLLSRLMVDLCRGFKDCDDLELADMAARRIQEIIKYCLEQSITVDDVVHCFSAALSTMKFLLGAECSLRHQATYTQIMSLYLDYMREELDWKDDKVSQENKTAPDLVLLEKHGVPLANPHSIFALELINGLQKLLSVRGALIVVKVMDVLSVLPDSLRVHGMQLEAAGKFDQADWTVLTDTIAEATQALKIRYKFASSRRGSALPSDLSNLVSSSAPITPSPKVGPDVKLQAASSAVYNFNRRTSATKSVTSATATAGATVQRSAKRSSTRKSGSNLALPHGSPVRHRPMIKNSESTPELADSVDDDVVPAVDPLRAGYSAFLLSIKAMVKEQPRFCVAATD